MTPEIFKGLLMIFLVLLIWNLLKHLIGREEREDG